MARITVEDCLHTVDNLFDLVLLAAKRARRLTNGAEALGATVIPISGGNTRDVALVDLDNDGYLDAVIGNYNQQNQVYMNTGVPSGTFLTRLVKPNP